MSSPYVGEIRIFAGNFEPNGWMICNGRLLAISEYETLFNLIGTTYGGDGQSTYALPDLRGRIPMHWGTGGGNSYTQAETGGVEEVTLTVSQIPSHSHALKASLSPGHLAAPANALPARHRDHKTFLTGSAGATPLQVASIASVGGSQPHENRPPFLGVNFIISLFGVFPSQV